jgi:hypothetical protein
MIESRQRKPTRRVLGSWSSFPQISYARATQLHRDRPSPARCCSPAAAPDPPANDRSLEAVHAATPSSAARRQPLPGSAARHSLSSVTPDPQLESLSSSLGRGSTQDPTSPGSSALSSERRGRPVLYPAPLVEYFVVLRLLNTVEGCMMDHIAIWDN